MKIEWKTIKVNDENIKALITINEEGDQELLKKLYFDWKKLNDELKGISTRGINIPDTITENAFCLFFQNCVRIVKLAKGKCSYDCIDTNTGKMVQIKAASIYPDLTSFGPRSEYDELYFLDFSKGDGSFKIYNIPIDIIKKTKVNKTQTFEEQQAQKRRPRFSITEKIIKPKNLEVVKVCEL